jgi:hypothetical protein
VTSGLAAMHTLASAGGTVTAWVVTAVILLLLAAVAWSFMRRAREDGMVPLAVDTLDRETPEAADGSATRAVPPSVGITEVREQPPTLEGPDEQDVGDHRP